MSMATCTHCGDVARSVKSEYTNGFASITPTVSAINVRTAGLVRAITENVATTDGIASEIEGISFDVAGLVHLSQEFDARLERIEKLLEVIAETTVLTRVNSV